MGFKGLNVSQKQCWQFGFGNASVYSPCSEFVLIPAFPHCQGAPSLHVVFLQPLWIHFSALDNVSPTRVT